MNEDEENATLGWFSMFGLPIGISNEEIKLCDSYKHEGAIELLEYLLNSPLSERTNKNLLKLLNKYENQLKE
jgi:hypothetical protein